MMLQVNRGSACAIAKFLQNKGFLHQSLELNFFVSAKERSKIVIGIRPCSQQADMSLGSGNLNTKLDNREERSRELQDVVYMNQIICMDETAEEESKLAIWRGGGTKKQRCIIWI